MMFIRLLAVLGALATLAMAGTQASPTRSPTKEKTMSPKAPKAPKASKGKGKSKPTPHPPPKNKCPPKLGRKQCPCFQEDELENFLVCAAAKSGGDCGYSKFIVSDFHSWRLSAFVDDEYGNASQYLDLFDYVNDTDSCYLYNNEEYPEGSKDQSSNFDLTGQFNGTTSDCQKLIEDAKDHMVALSCTVRQFDLPNCTVGVPQWIGDGYCDSLPPYNTEDCGWDGGDCCQDTCVSSFSSCGINGYECLDPNSTFYNQSSALSIADTNPEEKPLSPKKELKLKHKNDNN